MDDIHRYDPIQQQIPTVFLHLIVWIDQQKDAKQTREECTECGADSEQTVDYHSTGSFIVYCQRNHGLNKTED